MKLEPKDEIYLLKCKIDKLQKIIDQEQNIFNIKEYSEVCKILKVKELSIKDFEFLPEEQRIKALAVHKIGNIEKLFNGIWIKDWNNINQYKYYPYFTTSGGLRFCGSNCYRSSFDGEVGFYKDKETSDFVGKIFIEIYKDLI